MATTLIKEHNLLFVHTPKTAGTSLCHWLSSNMDTLPDVRRNTFNQHYQYGKFLKKFDIDSNPDYFLFCRNPYDWVYSFYCHQVKRMDENLSKLNPPSEHLEYIKNEHYSSFEKWILNFDKNNAYYRNIDYVVCVGQAAYIDHKIPPLFTVRYENIEHDLSVLEKIINKKIILPSLNVSENKKDVNYTEQMKDKVYSLFLSDFKAFNYEK